MKNVIYFRLINDIGGVESWLYYLSKIYDFTFYYKTGSPEQIERLANNIEVIKYMDQDIECNNFICNYNPDILDKVKAKNYINMVHSDYKVVPYIPNTDEIFNIHIAVSKLAAESFKERTGIECETIYNPIVIDIPKVEKYKDNKIHLISATRLSKEKGLNRMQKLASLLDKSGIDYEWIVYTNRKRQSIGKNVIYKDSKLDILEDIAKADYLVQLSDCEAYCYTVVEALMVGTKVIATDLPVFKEIGLNKDNSIIYNLDMTNVDLNDIKKDYKEFKYKPPISNFDKYLDKKGKYDPNELIKARAKKRLYLIEEEKHLNRNEIIELSKKRVSVLECKGLVERI